MPDTLIAGARWAVPVRLADVQRSPQILDLTADEPHRRIIAKMLDLVELKRFTAAVSLRPWLDGLEITADWEADISQTCGVSLDVFDTLLRGAFTVQAVPADSDAAIGPDAELTIDPEAEDPPDVMDGEDVDVGAYLIEHLALDVDPFPRKPGAAFDPPPEEAPASPFAVLRTLNSEAGSS